MESESLTNRDASESKIRTKSIHQAEAVAKGGPVVNITEKEVTFYSFPFTLQQFQDRITTKPHLLPSIKFRYLINEMFLI